MATTPTYINQRINNLQAQINAISGGGVPTSSDLAVVLGNGNSAGTFDIDMSGNDILNANSLEIDNGSSNALLSIDASGNLLIDPSNNLVIGSGSSLTLQPTNTIATTLDKTGIFIDGTGTKTYPVLPFVVYPSYYSSTQVGNNQTINSGFNVVVGMYNQLKKNDGTTAVNTSLTIRGMENDITWSDSNCPANLTGMFNNLTYTGGTGTIAVRAIQQTQTLSPQTGSAITTSALNGIFNTLFLGTAGVANQTYNLASNGNGIVSSFSTFNNDVGNTNRLINITEYKSIRSFNSFGAIAGGTPATGCITTIGTYTMFSGELFFQQNGVGSTSTITNLYGLRLPNITNTGTITNHWGISQETTNAKNYFAGNVGIGIATNNSSAKLQVDSTTQGFLPPRMTGVQANAIATPAEGLMVYVTDAVTAPFLFKGWWGYNGATWTQIG